MFQHEYLRALAKFAMISSWGAWLVPDPVVHWLDWGIWILLRKVWLGLHEGCHHVWNSGRLWRWISYLPGQGLWPRGEEIQVECWTCKRTSGNDGHYRYVLSRWCCAQRVACSLHVLCAFFFFACSLHVLCVFQVSCDLIVIVLSAFPVNLQRFWSFNIGFNMFAANPTFARIGFRISFDMLKSLRRACDFLPSKT